MFCHNTTVYIKQLGYCFLSSPHCLVLIQNRYSVFLAFRHKGKNLCRAIPYFFFLPYHLLCFFLICGFRYWRKPQILQELFNIGGVYLCHIALCNIELVERQFLAVLVLEGIALKLRVLKHVIPQIEDNLADKLVCRYHAVLCLAKEIAEFLVLRISGFIHTVVDSREKLLPVVLAAVHLYRPAFSSIESFKIILNTYLCLICTNIELLIFSSSPSILSLPYPRGNRRGSSSECPLHYTPNDIYPLQ